MISMMPVKKAIGIIPIILMYLFGGGGTAAPASPALGTPAPQPLYQWETMTAQNQFAAEDGTELMYYSYQLLTLSVANLEELRSGEAAEAERNVENFNSKMTALLEESMEVGQVMQEDAAQLYKESGTAGLPFYDETSASCCRTGDLLSVRVSGGSYAGGAHPSRCDSGYLFDLRSGQFIDPTQIADKPEEFRTGAAALLFIPSYTEMLPVTGFLHGGDYRIFILAAFLGIRIVTTLAPAIWISRENPMKIF